MSEQREQQLKVLIEGYREEQDQRVEFDESWQQIYKARQNNLIMQADMLGVEVKLDKPCAVVAIGNVRGYIPQEYSGFGDVHELRGMIGEPIAFKVVAYDREGNTFIASRQLALEHMESVTWKRLSDDAVITAVVRSVERKSAKVDIGGIQLTIPVEEIGYGWIDDLRETLHAGDHIKVKVVELNKEAKHVRVSKKAVEPSPWPDCTKRFSKSAEYVGRVSGVMEYGVFVNLEPNVDALVPHLKFQNVNRGDRVLIRIRELDVKKERIYGRITKKL